MDKILKIETTGTKLISYIGYHKEKEVEKVLKNIKNQYIFLKKRHFGDHGKLKVSISTYNPELPYRF